MTKEQQIASNPKFSVWVTANAGTGKTKVLTDRVLRLLLAGSKHSSILCLTYTKAAASEMYQRITDKLVRWTILSDVELYEEVQTLTGVKPDASILSLARTLFATITDSADGIKIQTIHSFCQSLLQRFPLEADITPGFTLIDDRMEQELCTAAKQRVLHFALQDEDEANQRIIEAVDYFNRTKTEYGFETVIETVIANLPKIRSVLSCHKTVDAYIDSLYALFGLDSGQSLESIEQELCNPNTEEIQKLALILAEGSRTNQENAAILSGWLQQTLEEKMLSSKEYRAVFLKIDGEAKQLKSIAVKKLRDAYPDLDGLIENEQARLIAMSEKQRSLKTLLSTQYFMYLAEVLNQEYLVMKQRKGFIDYHDVIECATKLLAKPGISAWILYKISQKIQHVLIDESQDTSPYQWQLIRHITDDFFHGDTVEHEGLKPTLFVVGDEKQSIYSFQGADTSLYAGEFRALKTKTDQNPEFDFRPISMNLSFRTTEAVLNVVDHIFNQEGNKEAVSYQPEPLIHNTHRVSQAGVVEVWPLIEQEKQADATEIDWSLLAQQNTSQSVETMLAVDVADKINHWILSGEILKNKGRPIRAGDIMILVEKRTEFIYTLTRELKQRNISVAPSDRIKLQNEIIIHDLVSLAHFLLLPEDDLSLAEILKSPLFGLSEDALYDLAYDRGTVSLWQRLQQSALHQESVAILKSLLNKVDYVPIIELYSYILDELEGRKQCIARLGYAVDEVINEFFALILEYENHHSSSLQQFIDWFSSNSAIDIKREQSQTANEVRIMTIHGSKGLQAPIVILADISKSQGSNRETLVVSYDNETPMMLWSAAREDRNQAYHDMKAVSQKRLSDEKLRLLYVAITRAEDEFYACGIPIKKGDNSKRWYNMLQRSVETLGEEVEAADGRIRYRYALHDHQSVPEARNGYADHAVTDMDEALPELFNHLLESQNDASQQVTPIEEHHEEQEPSRLNDTDTPLSPVANERIHKGIIIHELLQILPKYSVNEREAIVEYMYRNEYADTLSVDLYDEITKTVNAILTNQALQFIFEKPSYAEVPVSAMYQGECSYGIIDRLVQVSDSNLLIVDYKTGKMPPKQVEDVQTVYIEQMRHYRNLIQSLFPTYQVSCAILWTKNQSLMYLTDDILGASEDQAFDVTEAQIHTQLTLSL